MDVIAPKKKKKSTATIAQELKFLDNTLVASALSFATDNTGAELDPATTLCLTAPAQGDGANNRDGKQIIAKSIHVSGLVFIDPAEDVVNPPPTCAVQIALVLDRQTNNAQLNSEDVYTNPGAAASTLISSIRNMSFGKRFKVLKMERFSFDNSNLATTATDNFDRPGRSYLFDWFIPLNDMKINFNTTSTGVIGNVLDNSIHVIGWTNVSTPVVGISYNARFRFLG